MLVQPFIKTPYAFLFLIVGLLLVSACNKRDFFDSHSEDKVQKFFKLDKDVSPNIRLVYERLVAEHRKTGFVDRLPGNLGSPIWDKIKIKKERSLARGGTSASETIIIPLTNDDPYLSGVLIGKEGAENSYTFTVISNEYLYEACHSPGLNIQNAEGLLALFLYMDNYSFGVAEYKNIPEELFTTITGSENINGTKTIRIKAQTDSGSLLQISYPEYWEMCFIVQTANSCTCGGNSSHNPGLCQDWETGCPDCSDTYCFDGWIRDNDIFGGGASPSPTGPGVTILSSGGGGGSSSQQLCRGVWYRPGPCSTATAPVLPPLDSTFSTEAISFSRNFRNSKTRCVYDKLKSSNTFFNNLLSTFDGIDSNRLRFDITNLPLNEWGITAGLDSGRFNIFISRTVEDSFSNLAKMVTLAHELIHARMFYTLEKAGLIHYDSSGAPIVKINMSGPQPEVRLDTLSPADQFKYLIISYNNNYIPSYPPENWTHHLFTTSYFDVLTYQQKLAEMLYERGDWSNQSPAFQTLMSTEFGTSWEVMCAKYLSFRGLEKTPQFDSFLNTYVPGVTIPDKMNYYNSIISIMARVAKNNCP